MKLSSTLEIYPDVRLDLIERCRQELLIVNWVKQWSVFNAGVKLITGGEAGHSSVLVPEILPNGKSADSLMHVQAVGSGIEKSRVSHEIAHKDYAIVYRLRTPGDLSRTCNLLASLVDKKYDMGQIMRIFLNRIFGIPISKLVDTSPDKYICSEVASIALREYGAPSSSARPVGFIDPNTLVDIFQLEEVMRFKA